MITAEQVLNEELAAFCGSCGQELPEPGQPCAGCNWLPPIVRAEAAERLARPGAVAAFEAARLRREAEREIDRVRGLLREADMIVYQDGLEQERDAKAAELPPARAVVKRRKAELAKARDAVKGAEAAVEDSLSNYNQHADAWAAADKGKKSAAVRTLALAALNAAGPVLEADQAALRGAVAEQEAAGQAVDAAQRVVDRLESELAGRREAAGNPGRAPKSAITLTLDLAHQAQSDNLTEPEQDWLRNLGAALAAYTGAADLIAGLAIKRDAEEKAASFREQPMYAQPGAGDGHLTAIANPALSRVPV